MDNTIEELDQGYWKWRKAMALKYNNFTNSYENIEDQVRKEIKLIDYVGVPPTGIVLSANAMLFALNQNGNRRQINGRHP